MTSLREQNRWLRNPAQRERLLRNSAASSSAVEGIRKPYADANGKHERAGKAIRISTAQSRKSA